MRCGQLTVRWFSSSVASHQSSESDTCVFRSSLHLEALVCCRHGNELIIIETLEIKACSHSCPGRVLPCALCCSCLASVPCSRRRPVLVLSAEAQNISATPLMLCRGHRDAVCEYSTHKKSTRIQCSNLYTAPITKPTLELLHVLHLPCLVLAALLCLESSPAQVPQRPAAEVLAALRRPPPTGKMGPASRGPKDLAIRP